MEKNVEDILKQFRFRMPVSKRWSDLDEAGHVNNAVYLTYFEESRGHYFQEACQWDWTKDGIILANNQVDYFRPLLYLEPTFIYVRTTKLGTKSIEVQYAIVNEYEDRKVLVSRGSSVLVMYDYRAKGSVPVPDYTRERITAYEPQPIS
ncbi:MAG: acyl-CoA thioesterase [Bacteroidetes bacterium]|nr:acyl-CoA thioesterase [Bacteroidota bacterium]